MESPRIKMGTELNNSINSLIRYDYEALLGVETATEYWGLSTFYSPRPITLIRDNTLNNDGYETENAINILFVPNVNTENVVYLSEHLRVTDLEQTVVDMVRYNRHEFHLYETLISAIDEHMADEERLEKIARQYGVYDKMQELFKLALQAEEEDAE